MISVHVPLHRRTRAAWSTPRASAACIRAAVVLNFARAPIVDESRRDRSARQRPSARLHLRFPDAAHSRMHPRAITLAAPRCLHRRGRGELRGHGGRHAARFSGERQHPQLASTSPKRCCRACRARCASRSPTATCPTWWARSPPCWPSAGINIADLLNKSRGECAYTLIDAEGGIDDSAGAAAARASRACCRRASCRNRPRSRRELRMATTRKPARKRARKAEPGKRPLASSLESIRAEIDALDRAAARADQPSGRGWRGQVGISKHAGRPHGRFLPAGARGRGAARRAGAQPRPAAQRRNRAACSARSCRPASRSRSRSRWRTWVPRAPSRRPRSEALRSFGAGAGAAAPATRCSRRSRRQRRFRRGRSRELERRHGHQHARSLPRAARCTSAARSSCASITA